MTKALTSASNWRLAGNPNPINSRTAGHSGARNQWIGTQSRTASDRMHHPIIPASIASRASNVATPAPSSPRRGAPRFP